MKMDVETVEINGKTYVRKSEIQESVTNTDGFKYCIIRCKDAGVHAGFVEGYIGREVTLLNSRRLWSWWGKTLSGLAIEGSFAPEKCKYSDELPRIILLEACEIIECSPKGVKSIREDVGPWKDE